MLDVCRVATESPSLLFDGQKRMIWCVWQELAEENKLHGIRTANSAMTVMTHSEALPEKEN